jgi:hypothetical protein
MRERMKNEREDVGTGMILARAFRVPNIFLNFKLLGLLYDYSTSNSKAQGTR